MHDEEKEAKGMSTNLPYTIKISLTVANRITNIRIIAVVYRKVCGRAIGYQYGHTDVFAVPGTPTINGVYIDGLSIRPIKLHY